MRTKTMYLAAILLTQVVIASNAYAASTLEEANLAYKNQNIDQATQLYQQSLQDDPQSPDAKVGLAYCYFVKRQYPRATDQVNEVLAINSTHIRGLLLRGRLNMQSGNLVAAKEAFQQVVAVDPNNVEAHTSLGNALFGLGDEAGADAHYNTVRSLVSPGQ
ncbi:TPR repeat protein [Thiogranum longum]|uniref:TPR repeat protein n=1 Tax=Thiogranum longum TaxID=1537524 RepID=A0A4R1HE14_9GAMM|nr:tetratricopeptide repeat protein [Thiogranum longum]TCK18883.1 TPR repeat protein [Thiogranum longum]